MTLAWPAAQWHAGVQLRDQQTLREKSQGRDTNNHHHENYWCGRNPPHKAREPVPGSSTGNSEAIVSLLLAGRSAFRRTDSASRLTEELMHLAHTEIELTSAELSLYIGGLWCPPVWRLLGPTALQRKARYSSKWTTSDLSVTHSQSSENDA